MQRKTAETLASFNALALRAESRPYAPASLLRVFNRLSGNVKIAGCKSFNQFLTVMIPPVP